MEKRVLMVATVPSMIGQFNIPNINLLKKLGYVVDIACDFTDFSVWPIERVEKFKMEMHSLGVECIQLNFSRNALNLFRHFKSYKEALNLLRTRYYSFIHTHTPIASAIIRLVAFRTKTKVIYTAHGFHFFKGAPLKNWLIFYPIEKFLSKYTDVLITINQEDYKRALKKFKAKNVIYVPGVGIDTKKFLDESINTKKIREELGLNDSSIMFLSVGELSTRKNHVSVIKALNELNNSNFYYFIVGKGVLYNDLKKEDKTGRLRLLGFRSDIVGLLQAADVFVFPSLQEGLPVALMEAMASGLPCIVSKIRGNEDLIEEKYDNSFFDPKSIQNIINAIKKVAKRKMHNNEYCLRKIKDFDISKIDECMVKIYSEI